MAGSLEGVARLNAIVLPLVHHRDQTNDTAVSAVPVPGEESEGATFAGDGVNVAADVFNAENAVAEELVVNRLPLGVIFVRGATAGPLFVLVGRCGSSGPLRCGPIAVASG